MKVVGLDLGTKTLGIAISDITKTLARGLENYRFESENYPLAVKRVEQLLNDEKVSEIILGHPKNMDGSLGKQAQITEEFKRLLEQKTATPVILWDERLSTQQASRNLISNQTKKKKRKSSIDQEAAIFILQSYLDAKK